MALFFNLSDSKREPLKSIDVMQDGAAVFGAWHLGTEKMIIMFTPPSPRALLSDEGDVIDQSDKNARQYTVSGSDLVVKDNVTLARIFLDGTPPRPYSEFMEIKVIPKAEISPPPPQEKQATPMQCWAGALSSWTRKTNNSNESIQAALVAKYSDVPNGGCSEAKLKTVMSDLGFLCKAHSSYTVGYFKLAEIQSVLAKGKCLVLVYKSSRLNSHTVVIYGLYSPRSFEPTLKIMDPWSGTHEELSMSTLVGRAVLLATPR